MQQRFGRTDFWGELFFMAGEANGCGLVAFVLAWGLPLRARACGIVVGSPLGPRARGARGGKSLFLNLSRVFEPFSLFGMVEWPFQRLSDLQLGDKKVTLNHLVEEYCKLQVPKLAFRRKNASKTFFYVVFKLDTLPFQSESIVTGMYSCTKKKDRSLKHATLLRYKRLWKRDRKLFREDFFPPFARRTAQ